MSEHTLNIAVFRENFPEFSDTSAFPDNAIQAAWRRVTFTKIYPFDNFLLCGRSLQYALELATAHVLFIQSQNLSDPSDPEAGGSTGGSIGGIVQSASEGSVSVSLKTPDINSWLENDLAQSAYGQDVLQIIQGAIVGGVYIGGSPETSAVRDVGGIFSWQRGFKNDCN